MLPGVAMCPTGCHVELLFLRRSAAQVALLGLRRYTAVELLSPSRYPRRLSTSSRRISSRYSSSDANLPVAEGDVVADGGSGVLRSPDLVDKEYAKLRLKEKLGHLGHVRIRQHVNPLSSAFSAPVPVPDWKAVFRDPALPLMVDIGCDPHFKKRHHKRRVLQKPLVESISRNLHAGGQVFFQSDVLEVALDMRDQFDAQSDLFQHADGLDPALPCDGDGWLLKNPMGIRTEREIHAESEGARIYRRMYRKGRPLLPS